MSLLPARLRVLNLAVFPLEATSLCLVPHLRFHKVLGSIFPIDAPRVPLSWSLDDCANLRESRYFALPAILLVVPVRIEHIAHFDELKIAFESSREFSFWEVEPLGTCIGLIVLRKNVLAFC